ncbi:MULTISPECIES: DEAD/DEAH box helicase [Chromobacterium]|uniref:DEAD/DEAH box helicase n=2 Tax=Chromobacterium TaxID=535 RepID=A0ABS3GPV2_9NEIS|nr:MULTISPECIES: DEAD/DEAH box helicase [Chromobacterium]AXT47035.1 DEAD/DEAH box helicase [Chromobacterium rhizoryzae]MBK0415671.1 DEAD/DEAH box helicase [Chromobacterium haemolyticum]MBO0417085.1 DEAD/DEAH box helicase [Chromobacterium haemolyticum]MBO0500204.1 DEAD/DEAH box helicase [Chromobacterium haemolyticum]MDH0342746.1 DEAD/DEAH box helicase [Chromobacterium haemolyticum]
MHFSDLGIAPTILRALEAAGYSSPTEVQAQAVPAAIAGRDLLVSAQTGSGKTAAFLLPALTKLSERSTGKGQGPRVLVLCPTRELAQQVEKNALEYGKDLRWMKTVCLVGGSSFGYQTRALSRPVDLIVATPGRLMDHMRSGRIDFSRLEMLVLDEADRMLDMGFIEDIETIVKATPDTRQTVLFSATLDGTVGRMAEKMTRDPQRIEIARTETSGGTIEEHLLYADDLNHKHRLLDHILKESGFDQCVIFSATKAYSEELADKLSDQGYSAACLHGDMPQSWRNRTLNDLRRGRIKILVATDVAARGIDVPTITHVVNFDLPKQAEDYVHRIGRTGRAGRDGTAITLAESKEFHKVRRIEQYLKRQITEGVIEGMEPTRRPPKGPRRNANGKGGYGDRRPGSGGGRGGYGNRREGGYQGQRREGGYQGNRGPRSTQQQ